MRKTGFLLSMVFGAIFLLQVSGCILAVHPVVSIEDAERDDRLIGHWKQESGDERMVITPGEGDYYEVEYRAKDVTVYFNVIVGTIGEHTVLDVSVAPKKGDPETAYADLMITGHVTLVADISQDKITLFMLDIMDTITALDSGDLDLAYTADEQKIVLLDSTEKLRESLSSYMKREDVLDEMEGNWVRMSAEQLAEETGAPDAAMPCFEASEWPEADELFLWHPNWVGGDGASSVDLGDGRVLWLFGDSWVDPSGENTRDGAKMVSNTVAIQRGYDPANAEIGFFWGKQEDGTPRAFIPDDGAIRHWFGNGVLVDGKLVLFMNQVRNTDSGLGFETVGWTAFLVDNPAEAPDNWDIKQIDTPENPLGALLGFAAVWKEDGYVYGFGSQDPVKSHPVFVARWSEEDIRSGELMNPEWWSISKDWIQDSSNQPRQPIFENGASELSVHKDPDTGSYLAFQTVGFGPAELAIRTSASLTGPWSGPRILYRPPEYARDDIMIYSGKAHPELVGAPIIATYATNSFDFSDQLYDYSIYYPRFVRLNECAVEE